MIAKIHAEHAESRPSRNRQARPANRLRKSPLRSVKLHAADDADDGLPRANHFSTEFRVNSRLPDIPSLSGSMTLM